jgi:hypothetical protein
VKPILPLHVRELLAAPPMGRDAGHSAANGRGSAGQPLREWSRT